jgi:hypothetical protein
MKEQIESLLKESGSQLAVIGETHQDLIPNLDAMLVEYRNLCEEYDVSLEDLPATIKFLLSYDSFLEAIAKFAGGAV